ncbi:MAG TPA: hypothetical protein PLI76_00640 [Methanoculleus sp.]|nr:hypothetical protein [Methanoculleus sp.]
MTSMSASLRTSRRLSGGRTISNRRKMRSEMQAKFPWTEANVRISSAEGTSA